MEVWLNSKLLYAARGFSFTTVLHIHMKNEEICNEVENSHVIIIKLYKRFNYYFTNTS